MSDDLPAAQVDLGAPPKKSKRSKPFWIALEIAAIFIWTFSLCKLFLFDIDSYLVANYMPAYEWLLNYKILFTMGLVTALLWLWGPRLGLFMLGLLIFYPIFFVLWRIPSLILQRRSWVLVFAAFNFTIEFFRSFRRNVTIATLLISCFVISVVSSHIGLLYLAAGGLLAIIVYLYYATTFRSAFAPATIYTLYARLLPPVRGYVTKTNRLDETIRELSPAEWNEAQRKVWVEKIQLPILANRSYLFLARKFRDYQKSPVPYLHNVGIIVVLFLVTVIAFAGINFAIYKIEPGSYEVTKANLFSFVWYSFNAFVFNFVKDITPEGALAKSLWMTEAVLALFLVAIVVAMYLSIRSQRISDQVDAIVEALESEGRELESFVRHEYQITSIDEAVAELDRLKAGLVQVMLWLTRNLR